MKLQGYQFHIVHYSFNKNYTWAKSPEKHEGRLGIIAKSVGEAVALVQRKFTHKTHTDVFAAAVSSCPIDSMLIEAEDL